MTDSQKEQISPQSSPLHSSSSHGMRRSRSAGDKFVFGARRRTLTPAAGTGRKAIQPEASRIGVVSPRPIRSTKPRFGENYWSSNYSIKDIKSQHPEAFDEKEFEKFHKWLFMRDKSSTVDNDIRKLIKMLFKSRMRDD
ncbi:unnamed protein product [Auanema sp. JU1783]|nr:unnamed protein product [Auanema sp. JU1783]